MSRNAASYADTYQLQRKIGSGSWSTVQNSSSRSFNESGRTKGTYTYRVRAGNGVGNSAYSGTYTVTVRAPNVPDTPSASGLEYASHAIDTNGSFSVSWNATSYADTYRVERRINSGSWTAVQNSSSRSLSQSSLGGHTYRYRVSACDNVVGCSTPSGTRTVTVEYPPGVPSGINSPTISSNGLYTVTWASVSGASRYELQVKHMEDSTPQWETLYEGSATPVHRQPGAWPVLLPRACLQDRLLGRLERVDVNDGDQRRRL